MRIVGSMTLALWVVIGLLHTAFEPGYAQKVDPNQIMARAREALGGEARLSQIKTFVATGRTRQVRGDNLVPVEFEIQVELPDKYSRRDEFPAQDAGPATSGFNGDTLVQIPLPPPPPARAGIPPQTPAQLDAARRARVDGLKQDFARLLLGLLATASPAYPLTFEYVAQAEAPQGKADVLNVRGPGTFVARLFIQSDTHLPILISWEGRAPGPGAFGRPGGPGPAARGALPPPVENRLYFADYRDVDGVKLPFRLRRAVGSDTTEETTFDRFRLNARVDPRRFGGD